MRPPLGEHCCRVTTGMRNGEQPDFRRSDDVVKTVRKAVEVQSAHVVKPDGVELCIAGETTVAVEEVLGKFKPQARLLVFIPVDGVADVSAKERMPSQRV